MAVRIMKDNLIDLDVVSTQTVSSEQAAFPVININNFARRSKVWRSNGFWEVTASNKDLYFVEDDTVLIGSAYHAELTVGTYSSSTAFFAHIKTVMEAVPGTGSTYTIDFDPTTGKVRFASNLVGGAGDFKIFWTSSTGLGLMLGFDFTVDNSGAASYVADVLHIHSNEWIKWDFGISTNPQAFIMAAKRNEPIKISPSATIYLQGNETDVWDVTPSYQTTIQYNDEVMFIINANGLHTEALRYWRLYVLDWENPEGWIELGTAFLGNFFQSTRGQVQFPFQGQYIDRSETVFSEGGQTFSSTLQQSEGFQANWFGLTIAEKEEIDAIFRKVGTSKPFFMQFDPSEAFSSSDNYYMRYVKFADPPTYTLVSPGNFTCSMNLREEL